MTYYYEKHSAIIKICRLAVCFVLALLLPLQAAYAADTNEPKNIVDPVRDKENISAVLYNNTNGLPTSEANAIAETRAAASMSERHRALRSFPRR